MGAFFEKHSIFQLLRLFLCFLWCKIALADITRSTEELHDVYRVRQNKISQHENYYISEMPQYFCTKFRSFVWHNNVH